MIATFTPTEITSKTIFKPVLGHAITPMLPNGKRVVLIVSDGDHAKVGRNRFTVTDLMTNTEHELVRADCGLGCRCAVAFA